MQIRWKHRALALFIALFTLFYAYSAQAVTRHPLFISAESQKGDVDFSEIKQGVCKFSHLNGGKYRLIVLDYSNGFETQLVVSGDKGAKTIPIDVKITGTPKTTLKHHPNKKKV